MANLFLPGTRNATIRRDGERVFLIDRDTGRTLLDLPWEGAVAIGIALVSQGRLAEEVAKRERVVSDQALLYRVGFPIGLVNDPRLNDEAMAMAVNDRKLRRYLPGGVKSKAKVGTPCITQSPPVAAPTKENDDGNR